MAARVSIGLLAVAAACHRAAPSARDHLLGKLAGDAVVVVVADGRAISHPRIRGVLDVVAARWPASLGCVLDAAFASDQVAVVLDRGGNITATLATRSSPRCAALSQREPGLWVATIGAGPAAVTRSVIDDARFARARPYLETAPIAAVALGQTHVLATATPDPFEAWVAIDVADRADAVEQTITAQIGTLQRDPATAALAARLHLARPAASQLVVRLDGPVAGDLAAAARAVLAWADDRAHPVPAVFSCPPPAPGVTCSDDTSYRVPSLERDLAAIVTVGRPAPVVSNGLVTGLRLDAAVRRLGLDAGDQIIAMAGRLVTSRAMLADRIAHARGETTVTVRRGTSEKVLHFAEALTE